MAQFTGTAGSNDTSRLLSAAAVNNTLVKAGAGRIQTIIASNTNAAVRYLKLYDKLTAPAAGTDTPFMTIVLPPGQVVSMTDLNIGFRSGLGIATTTGVADSDTAAVAANEIIVHLAFR